MGGEEGTGRQHNDLSLSLNNMMLVSIKSGPKHNKQNGWRERD